MKFGKQKVSLVIGYCTCANCGWTDNKFNWHTYFKCPACGCLEFEKPILWWEENDESEAKEIPDDCNLLDGGDSSWFDSLSGFC